MEFGSVTLLLCACAMCVILLYASVYSLLFLCAVCKYFVCSRVW